MKEFDQRRARNAFRRKFLAYGVIFPAMLTLILSPLALLAGRDLGTVSALFLPVVLFFFFLVPAVMSVGSMLLGFIRFLETIHRYGTLRRARVVRVDPACYDWFPSPLTITVEVVQEEPTMPSGVVRCWVLLDQASHLKQGDIVQVLDARGAPGVSPWLPKGILVCLPMWKEDAGIDGATDKPSSSQ